MEEDGERGGNVGMACLRALLSRETLEKRERNIKTDGWKECPCHTYLGRCHGGLGFVCVLAPGASTLGALSNSDDDDA